MSSEFKEKLQSQIKLSQEDMKKAIVNGDQPHFGYPMITFNSPNSMSKQDFWKKLYNSVLYTKLNKTSSLSNIIEKQEYVQYRHDKMLQKFTMGALTEESETLVSPETESDYLTEEEFCNMKEQQRYTGMNAGKKLQRKKTKLDLIREKR